MRFHLKLSWKLMLWACCALLMIGGAAWAQQTMGTMAAGSTPGLPSVGEVKDWAAIGVMLTAAISALNKIVGVFYKGTLSELQKRAIAGFVCLVAAVVYSAQAGYFQTLDWRNLASIIAAVGIIGGVAKNFYDGISQPLGKVLSTNTATKAAPPVTAPDGMPSLEAMLRDALKKQEDANAQAAIVPAPEADKNREEMPDDDGTPSE